MYLYLAEPEGSKTQSPQLPKLFKPRADPQREFSRDITPIMENQMENEMETSIIGFRVSGYYPNNGESNGR